VRAQVTQDSSIREITLTLTDAPHLDVTRPWHRQQRVIQPGTVRMVIVNDQPRQIRISGYLVLKGSGRVSDKLSDGRTYFPGDQSSAPQWVREIWRQAPGGITGYSWTEADLADEEVAG
jgi:hypothetical protein